MTVANKKIGIILLLVAFALVSLLVIATNEGVPDDGDSSSFTETEQYFIDQVTTQTLERIDGQPIEGVEKSMYLQAFPGLQERDFAGVETLGDTNQADVQTSADATITDAGLTQLLENTADRLDLVIETPEDVDALLVTISQSTPSRDVDNATSSDSVDGSDEDAATSSVRDGAGDGDIAASCVASGGNWLSEYSECEYVSNSWCSDNDGVFQECASACRHNDAVEPCQPVCVAVCQLGQ